MGYGQCVKQAAEWLKELQKLYVVNVTVQDDLWDKKTEERE